MSAIVPIPRVSIEIRPATMEDISFIDSLQKMHAKMVGWMPTKQIEGKIAAGHVLVAVGATLVSPSASDEEGETSLAPTGYCIGHDQYFKRDDVGIIYQLNVVPGKQRSLIGAMLVKAMFERAAYGCRLFCCWCAQDIEANHFWESLGFIPLAFRAGSREKGRVHIFWQRRIRAGDTTTPYWFPSQTTGGSIREDRLVLPIPPGTHWSDAKPLLLPKAELSVASGQLPVKVRRSSSSSSSLTTGNPQLATISSGGLRFVTVAAAKPVLEKPKKSGGARQKVKNDPRLIAAARELRDRWLERVNTGSYVLDEQSKYDVSKPLSDAEETRQLHVRANARVSLASQKQLPAAA